MRRKRRRKIYINWGPVLWLFLMANCVAGFLYSPLTHLRAVRVVGASVNDEDRIGATMNGAEGLAWMKIPVAQLETELARLPEVKSAQIHRNMFGRALVRIEYRRPIAGVVGATNVAMDDQGVLYATKQSLDGLPRIDPPPHTLGANLAFAGVWPAEVVVQLCEDLATDKTLAGTEVQVDGNGRLSLGKGASGQVILGSLEDINTKLNVLRRLLSADPDLLSKVKELNLTDPKHPVQILLPLKKEDHS